ncbi:calmodulin-beta-like [Gigantopelta aegis]|uniref:calmodulin-beta-like n=1 Tax=Gigantopelta aegis TaxID=1735272 RepID=UPI001B88BF5C|nr:calmodulin-beta-like [Gigantopelta aegis]
MREMEGQAECRPRLNQHLSNGFNEIDRHELQQAFELFDKNQDGKISSEELGCVLRTLGYDYSQTEVEEMIKNADTNENGFVEYDEFISLMTRWSTNQGPNPEQEDKFMETFKVFDMDGNGYIDKHELRYVMRRLGENLSEEDTKAMFQLADLNGDGLIDFDEFCKLMGGLNSFPRQQESTSSMGESSKSSGSEASKN